jgi:hypothetical protein
MPKNTAKKTMSKRLTSTRPRTIAKMPKAAIGALARTRPIQASCE